MAGATKSASDAPELIRRIMALRGIPAAQFDAFLNPSLSDLSDSCELPGIREAADIAIGEIASGGEIIVFGDYDCDGICATAILSRCIAAIGGTVSAFVPDRLSEGYGMSDASVSRMLAEHPSAKLVITVDNGIGSVEQIDRLAARGIRCIVTDHHLPGDTLPGAAALVNPMVESPECLSGLCGAGVAYFLSGRIVAEAKARGMYAGANIGGPFLVLAGLATVTDMMPLVGQNRALVAEALKRFGSWAPLGLRELYLRAARVGADKLTSRDFGFLIGPRINAAGRIGSAKDALDLLMSDDRETARELARIVDMRNSDRKSVEQKMTEDALRLVADGAPAQVIDLPDGHPGVAGIVAARVMERLMPPVPVFVIASGRGSARAPQGVNVRDVLEGCADLLLGFGGHAAAAGFSVKPGKVDAFRKRICKMCRAVGSPGGEGVLSGGVKPDMDVAAGDLTVETVEWLSALEPFGEGNPEPVFAVRNARISDVRPLGYDGRHLSLEADGARCVWWGHGNDVERIRADSLFPHDIFFSAGLSDYGERHVEFRIKGIEKSGSI